MKLRLRIASFSAPLIALAISFGLSSLILLFIGKDPIETFQIMFEYGTKGKSIVSIINRSIPLYISAIAVAVGFKMGLFNIGVEGQYLMGSLIAAFVGSQFSIITPIHVLFIILMYLFEYITCISVIYLEPLSSIHYKLFWKRILWNINQIAR